MRPPPPRAPRPGRGAHPQVPRPGPDCGRPPSPPVPLGGSGEARRAAAGRGRRVPGGDSAELELPAPFPPRPRPGAKSPALGPGAGLQRRFEEGSEFRGLSRWPGAAAEERLKRGGGRRGSRRREGAARSGPPGSALPRWAGSSGPPRAWPSRLPVSACPVPAPARRSLAVVPSPAPRPLSSSLDSAWGFAGFWEIKTASNSGGALPGQTGPGGPCAPSYRPRAGAPGFGGPGEGAAGQGPGTQAPVMPPASQSRGPILEVSGSGRGAASVSRPGRRHGPAWRPPAELSAPPGLWVSRCVAGATAPPGEVSGECARPGLASQDCKL